MSGPSQYTQWLSQASATRAGPNPDDSSNDYHTAGAQEDEQQRSDEFREDGPPDPGPEVCLREAECLGRELPLTHDAPPCSRSFANKVRDESLRCQYAFAKDGRVPKGTRPSCR